MDTKISVEWRPRLAFAGRVVIVGPPVTVIPVPDDFIACDWCGELIEDDPVAVIGTDAVCKQCLESVMQSQ